MLTDAGLLGRTDECALLDGLVDDVRHGKSRSLVVRGEAGIGKTALLEYVVGSASDMTVARAVGIESEMELAYAGLHQLCAPMLDRLARVPPPQREALETAFALRAGAVPDRFLVGLAVLSLLAEVADERPLLCVVDDAQWLDRFSALTLAFVARRLLAEPVGIVFATREPAEALQHVPELKLDGLRPRDARELLRTVVPFQLHDAVRDRIIGETRGNPLALLELPRGLTATDLAAGLAVLGGQDLPRRIQKSFVRRLDALSGDAQRLVLLAAADPVGDPLVLWSAAGRLAIPSAAADEAEEHGLLTIDDRVRFRHPLARSAVYQSAPAHERRAAHRALAEAIDQEDDLDRRAWHLSAAAAGPDEEVAAELVRAAVRAQARGGVAAAATFLQRAVALTVDPERRVRRALEAAEACLQSGGLDVARELLATVEAARLDDLARARADLLRGQLELLSTFGSDALPLLLGAARRLERLDVALARDTYLEAWGAGLLSGALGTEGGLPEVSRGALAAPRPGRVSRTTDVLLDSLATVVVDGRSAALPLLEKANRRCREEGVAEMAGLRSGWLAVVPSYALWDEESTLEICTRQLDALRRLGGLARLPLDLATLNLVAARCGDFARAEEAAAEADALAHATGSGISARSAMVLAAFRGREEEARARIAAVAEAAAARGQGVALELTSWLTAVLCNGLGRYEEAVAAARGPEPGTAADAFLARKLQLGGVTSAFAAVELLEAATRSHRADVAGVALRRVLAATEAAGTDAALGLLARCRALLAGGEEADRLYREAIDRLGRSRLRPELARAHLLYGEWLRRDGRRVDARAQLRAAHEHFAAIGMEAFAARASRELVATGEHVRKRTRGTRDELTAQERQIARLARDGLSNPDIGARLFLSPRTVEWHLHKVFTKLGIRSRQELHDALPG